MFFLLKIFCNYIIKYSNIQIFKYCAFLCDFSPFVLPFRVAQKGFCELVGY